MRKHVTLFGLLMLLPAVSLATWQVADPLRGANPMASKGNLGYPQRYAAKVTAQIRQGDLQQNVKRIAKENHWHVIWHVKKPMKVLLSTHLAGANFVEVMNALLSHYPLEASYRYNFQNHGKTLIVKLAQQTTDKSKSHSHKNS